MRRMTRFSLAGIAHVQLEPVWGGSADTAGTLRGTCALALVQCRSLSSHQVLRHLTPLFADSELPVRVNTARAVEQIGTDSAALLLKLRAELASDAPEVLGACYAGLLRLEGRAGPALGRTLSAPASSRRRLQRSRLRHRRASAAKPPPPCCSAPTLRPAIPTFATPCSPPWRRLASRPRSTSSLNSSPPATGRPGQLSKTPPRPAPCWNGWQRHGRPTDPPAFSIDLPSLTSSRLQKVTGLRCSVCFAKHG